MNYLITGGSGFIGSHLIQHILAVEGRSKILVVDPNIQNVVLHPNVTYKRCHIRDLTDADIKEIDYVYHLGAVSSVTAPRDIVYLNNVTDTAVLASLLMHSISVKSVIFASSSACFPPIMSDYGISKLLCEEIMLELFKKTNLNVTCLRLGNVIGERQNPKNSTVVPTWIENYIGGWHCKIYGTGEQKRSYIYVGDVCTCMIASKNIRGYNILGVAGETLTTNQVADIFTSILPGIQFKHAEPRAVDKNDVEGLKHSELLPEPRFPAPYGIRVAIRWRLEQHPHFTWDTPIML